MQLDIVPAHADLEIDEYIEIIPSHIDRDEAPDGEFRRAKKLLARVLGKRCIVCEMRGEQHIGNIEAHHIFEWSHWQDNDMQMVEITLRALSPFVHGLYMMPKEEILNGESIPSLWNHSELQNKPFASLDDPRNLFFLCHAHHQQSTDEQVEQGYDVIGIHNVPFPVWLQYLGMKNGKLPVRQVPN